MSMREYFNKIGRFVRTPVVGIPEEESEELEASIDIIKTSSTLVDVLEIDLKHIEENCINFDFFIDGVERTHVISQITIPNNPPIPVVASHVVSGALGIQKDLRDYIECCLLIFPHQAVMEFLNLHGISIPLPQLDYSGDFFTKCRQYSLVYSKPTFFIDSSWKLEKRGERSINKEDLPALGKIRRIALARVDVVRRSLELGEVSHIRSINPNSWILYDGPLVRPMFLAYGRLAKNNLEYLTTTERRTFNFLKRIIGVVKEVRRIPTERIYEAFDYDASRKIIKVPLYRIYDNDHAHLVHAFMMLRPELFEIEPVAISPTAGLIRVDIPIPAILEEYDPEWFQFSPNIDNKIRRNIDKVEAIIKGILKLRYPLPETSSIHRILTELYHIHVVESYLKNVLLPSNDLLRYFVSEVIY